MTVRLLSVVCVLLLPSIATAGAASGCDDLMGRPMKFGVDWQTEVKAIINEVLFPTGRCTSCHNPGDFAGALDLSDAGVDALNKILGIQVIAGDPTVSLLFEKVNCALPAQGNRMPLGGNALTIDEQELIYDWIWEGAYGENPKDPLNRDFIYRDGTESIRKPFPGL